MAIKLSHGGGVYGNRFPSHLTRFNHVSSTCCSMTNSRIESKAQYHSPTMHYQQYSP